MNKKIKQFGLGLILALGMVFVSISMTSCDLIWGIIFGEYDYPTTDYEDSSNELADLSSDADMADSEYIVTLSSSKNSVTLNGVKGKTITYANFNKGSKAISKSSLRTLGTTSGLDTKVYYNSSSDVVIPFTSSSSDRSVAAEMPSVSGVKHFNAPQSYEEMIESAKNSARSAVEVASPARGTVVSSYDFTVNKSTKNIYIDCNADLSKYKSAASTLRGIGYDDNNDAVCLVWVVDSYYTTLSSMGNKVTAKIAQSIADKFAKYYALERAVFGNESEYLITTSGNLDKSATMDSISDTGSLVNIVIYDIGADYGAATECGVAGYFYSKDYFEKGYYSSGSVCNYTNAGKYFYIDSAYCNFNSEATEEASQYVNVTGEVSGTALSTLFHEFQHMINFSTKNINGIEADTWYNEMLSMLAEDVLAEEIGFTGSDAVWAARLPGYNEAYYMSALDEYVDGENAVCSYYTAYALGSYLVRNYGGVQLVKEMSTNKYGDWDSILNAIYKVSGKSLSRLQVIKEVLAASVLRSDFAYENNLPTFYKTPLTKYNVSVTQGSTTYTAKVNPIDLYSDSFKYTYKDLGKTYKGPMILDPEVTPSTLDAHRYLIHYAGVATSDTVTLNFKTFGSSVNSNEQIVIFIQDEFTNKSGW